MANPRLLIEQTLGPGARIALDEAQSRHVGTVLRLKQGDRLRVFNAVDGEWRAIVTEASKRGLVVAVEAHLRAAYGASDLDLLFAPVKRHATDLIIEKATELGVRRIRPVITQRTIAETVRLDRLGAIAREAAEQTERFDVPEIAEPVTLPRVLDGWDASRTLFFADEAGDAAPLLEALRSQASPRAGEASHVSAAEGGRSNTPTGLQFHAPHPLTPAPPRDRNAIPLNSNSPAAKRPVGGGGIALLIGPEGGFTPEERRMLRALSFVAPVSLGPRILRAETAAIAALTLIQAGWGDWRRA